MTKNQIPDLLNELQNDEAYMRNDAIKKNLIDNDSSMSVRNFARSALNSFGIEHSAFEEPLVVNPVREDKVVIDQETAVETYVAEYHLILRFIMGFYALALIPVGFCATQAEYLFDGGYTLENRILYGAVVSFPITIWVSFVGIRRFCSDRKYKAAFLMATLPVIHFIFLVAS
jgi:hypothetical protein